MPPRHVLWKEQKNDRNKYEAASSALSLNLAITDLGWKLMVKAKFMEVHASRWQPPGAGMCPKKLGHRQ